MRIECSLGHLDTVVGPLQAYLLGLHLGHYAQSLGIDSIGGGQRRAPRLHPGSVGQRYGKAFGRLKFEQLRQRKQRQAAVSLCLRRRETALRQRGFLLREVCRACLAVALHGPQPLHLHGVDGHLAACHAHNLHVVKRLHIGLGHLHPHVVAGFLKVCRGRLEVQAPQLYRVGYPHPGKQRHACAHRERRAARVGVCICVVFGQSAAEREVLPGRSVDRGQAAPLVGV